MSADPELPTTAVINLVLYSTIVNVFVLAVGFAVVAGLAFVRANPLAELFGPASGFLVLLATLIGVLRSMLVDLLEDLAF